jgi:hypothetical protein
MQMICMLYVADQLTPLGLRLHAMGLCRQMVNRVWIVNSSAQCAC